MRKAYRAARGLSLISTSVGLVAAIGVTVALGIALGPAIPLVTLGLLTAIIAIRWRRMRALRALAKSDPQAFYAESDREATRLGRYYAGLSFLVIGGGVVAIIVVFATHI